MTISCSTKMVKNHCYYNWYSFRAIFVDPPVATGFTAGCGDSGDLRKQMGMFGDPLAIFQIIPTPISKAFPRHFQQAYVKRTRKNEDGGAQDLQNPSESQVSLPDPLGIQYRNPWDEPAKS